MVLQKKCPKPFSKMSKTKKIKLCWNRESSVNRRSFSRTKEKWYRLLILHFFSRSYSILRKESWFFGHFFWHKTPFCHQKWWNLHWSVSKAARYELILTENMLEMMIDLFSLVFSHYCEESTFRCSRESLRQRCNHRKTSSKKNLKIKQKKWLCENNIIVKEQTKIITVM